MRSGEAMYSRLPILVIAFETLRLSPLDVYELPLLLLPLAMLYLIFKSGTMYFPPQSCSPKIAS